MPNRTERLNELNRKRGLERATSKTYKLYPADLEILEYIQAYLGGSKSDAFRTALRAYAFHIQTIRGKS